MTKYKIFYDDGSVYEGINPPAEGVQVIVMPNPDGGIITVSKTDYYVLDQRIGDDEPRWYGADISGLFQYLKRTGLVLFGLQISSKEFRKILETALQTRFDD